jgi:hypothetical protein
LQSRPSGKRVPRACQGEGCHTEVRMTYRDLIHAAKNDEPLEQEPTWFQEQVMAFARGWRASPVHYCVAIAVGFSLLGIGFVRLSVPSQIRVETTPDGATTLVDGKDMGKTPVVLSHLDKREHKLELNKPGYEPFQTFFGISPGAPSSYQFALRKLPQPPEPPAPIATSTTVPLHGPTLAMADATPTSTTLAYQFRHSRPTSHPAKQRSKHSHRHR